MSTSRKIEIKIHGMFCTGCENTIKRKLHKTRGIQHASVSYDKGLAIITYSEELITPDQILQTIQSLDYSPSLASKDSPERPDHSKLLISLLLILILYMLIRHSGLTAFFNQFPQAEEGMGYGMLFLTGLLTSVHCIAMCGGINLSQCLGHAAFRPGLLYNTGRVTSYTLIGALAGALGSVIQLTGHLKGLVQILAGLFMIVMGLNMLQLFPSLRKFMPRMPKRFTRSIHTAGQSNRPFYVGLLNGLMPCGPLQAMQLYALSTGNPAKGALSMLVFSLGTVPLMLGMGILSSYLSKKFAARIMSVGAMLVIVLGVTMMNNGLTLSGFSTSATSLSATDPSSQASIEGDVQIINTNLSPGSYDAITVQAGLPVKWTITAEPGSINGCNNRIFIPAFGIEKAFEPGENIIEFTPSETGTFSYSCWMGMIRSTITVVEEGSEIQENTTQTIERRLKNHEKIICTSSNRSCCIALHHSSKFIHQFRFSR